MDGCHPVAEAHEEKGLISRTGVARRAGRTRSRAVFHRFAKFSAVGAGGVIVQTVTLGVLLRVGGMHYLMATALAVEASVLNNFVWHRRWTWADRPGSCAALALLRFNATNGAMSLIGNLALMFILVSVFKVNPFASNLITIGICSFVNFALADRFVFI
jgi:putative flippase GtrA